jgi:hypothetical protein
MLAIYIFDFLWYIFNLSFNNLKGQILLYYSEPKSFKNLCIYHVMQLSWSLCLWHKIDDKWWERIWAPRMILYGHERWIYAIIVSWLFSLLFKRTWRDMLTSNFLIIWQTNLCEDDLKCSLSIERAFDVLSAHFSKECCTDAFKFEKFVLNLRSHNKIKKKIYNLIIIKFELKIFIIINVTSFKILNINLSLNKGASMVKH